MTLAAICYFHSNIHSKYIKSPEAQLSACLFEFYITLILIRRHACIQLHYVKTEKPRSGITKSSYVFEDKLCIAGKRLYMMAIQLHNNLGTQWCCTARLSHEK